LNRIVLDSSAILAIVNREDGAEVVRPILSDAVISAVNVAEVYTKLHEYSDEAVETARAVLKFVEIVPFDGEQARLTGELRPLTKKAGLSLGDQACLALGMRLDAEIYTTERAWGKLGLPCTIRMIRSSRESVQ
jgi:PIN domain nuclease of toxin-antitoxin system